MRGGVVEIERQGFRPARRVRRCGEERADGPVLETQPARDEILGFHAVHAGGGGQGHDVGDGTGEAQHQVERVDRLGDEHAAAVAGVGAATRLVVIGLRPPPGDVEFDRAQGAEAALFDDAAQIARRRGGSGTGR